MKEPKSAEASPAVTLFDRPKLVTYAAAKRSLWGGDAGGQVVDIFYGRNARIGALTFRLKPGGYFRLSEADAALFDQDRYYFVVEGELTVHDPHSGQVEVARAGEAIHWRRAKGHVVFNFTASETLVLDWYAPQTRPSHLTDGRKEKGAGAARANVSKPGRAELLGQWPEVLQRTRAEMQEQGGIIRITRAEALHFVHGQQFPVLESVYVSTRELTAGVVELMPSARSDDRTHRGDKVIVCLAGRLHVNLPGSGELFELGPHDVLYLPENMPHQYWNYSAEPIRFAFLVVPDYT